MGAKTYVWLLVNLKGSKRAPTKLMSRFFTILSTCCHQTERLVGSSNESWGRGLNYARRDFLAGLDRCIAEDRTVAASWSTVLTVKVKTTRDMGGICWKIPRWALLASKLFVLCCGLVSIGYGLSYTYFGWVCKGLLVFGAAKCITLPLELFVTTIWLG